MTGRDEYSGGAKLHLAGQDAYLHHVVITIVQLNWGGLPRVLVTLADEFVKRGVRVDLAVCEPGGTRVEAVPAGVRVFQLEESCNLATRLSALRADPHGWRVMLKPVLLAGKPPGYMIYMRSFVDYLRAEQPHVILSASRTLNVMVPWARKLARSHARIVLSEHNAPTPDLSGSAKWGRRFLAPLMARNYAMSDAVVAVSEGVADDLARLTGLPRERIKTIYNPIVNEDLWRSAEPVPSHKWFGPDQPPVILGAGRLVPAKDFPTLVRAFGLLRKKRNARLVILGSGKNEASTEKMKHELLEIAREEGVSEDIDLPGFVPNAVAYMASAALFVLSSAHEGFGNVLVEAMAVGCPVVSTDCPSGPAEILENGTWGKLTPVGDHAALAQAMLETLDHPIDADKLRQRAMHFSASRAADEYYLSMFVDEN